VTDLSKLERFRSTLDDQESLPGMKVEVAPIEWQYPGLILVVDQSLAATGWALMADMAVIDTGMCKTEGEGKGHEDTLRRGRELWYQFRDILFSHPPIDMVVHELPPIGSAMMRPESSLVAAMSLRLAIESVQEEIIPVKMIGAQAVKKRLTGQGGASKRQVSQVVRRICPEVIGMKPMNYNVTDAIGLGLVAGERRNGPA
jgi:Holliday junction resolvasome RuvABC endonuclease subunit